MKRLFKKAILAVGTYISPDRKVVVTPERLRHWEREHRRLTRNKQVVPAAWDHADRWEDMQPIPMSSYRLEDERPTARNTVGRMVDFRVTDGGKRAEILYEVRGQRGIDAVENNNVFVSPVILDEWQDGAGNEYRDVITHVDLVDHPVDYSQGPFIPVKGDGAAALSLAGREYCGLRMSLGRKKPEMFRLALVKPAKMRSTCMATIEKDDGGLFHVIDDGEIFATVDSEDKAQTILESVFGSAPDEQDLDDDPEGGVDSDAAEGDDEPTDLEGGDAESDAELEDDGDDVFAEFFDDDETDGEPDEVRMGDDPEDNIPAGDDLTEDVPVIEEPPLETPEETLDAAPEASPEDARWAAQIQEDLQSAGIAAPEGVDPITDTRAYLGQLCAALRQKRMDAQETDSEPPRGEGREDDDVTLARPEFAAMSNRVKRAEQKASAAEKQLVRMGQRALHSRLESLLNDGKITKTEFDDYTKRIQATRMSLDDSGSLRNTEIHTFIRHRESLPQDAVLPLSARLSAARPAERPVQVTGKLTPEEAKSYVDQQAARNPGVFAK